MLGHIIRHAHEFERIVNREARLKFTPQLRFVLDHSLEKGDHVLAILDTLPQAPQSAPAGEAQQ